MEKDLLAELEKGVLTLTLNRPDRLNAFSSGMVAALREELDKAESDPQIRIIMLIGAGRAFSAGGDIKGMGKKQGGDGTYEHLGRFNGLIRTIRDIEKPVVAAVHGYAAGAGFNLALACDMILAAEDTQFILSFSKIGLISDGGGLYFLPRMIGPYLAKELFFSAEPISAERAYGLGFINRIYPDGDFRTKAHQFAAKIAEGPEKSYGFIKKIANQSFDSTLDDILEMERITQSLLVNSPDHLEGINAFLEKRTPVFSKRDNGN